jgi:peptidyl-prolyl cis-trans isomerase SurA
MMNKWILVVFGLAFAKAVTAQTFSNPSFSGMGVDSTRNIIKQRVPIDGVAGVIGDYVILDSDIVREVQNLGREGGLDLSKCELVESMLQSKMFAHHAIQDSINVSDEEVASFTERKINYFKSKLGSDQAVADYYNRTNIEELRQDLMLLDREQLLAERMQQRLTDAVEITPEEVRQFFYSIPEEDRPVFGTEVNISQIVVQPKPTEDAIQETIDQLNEYRNDVLNNGASFAAKATLYSDDVVTERQGGIISLRRGDPFVTSFKDQAFSLQEGEISEPFETPFGWHILLVEDVRGQVRDVRHILLKPFISTTQLEDAREELDKIRDKIVLKEITFAEAAKQISDEEETAPNGGQLTNPATGGKFFEVVKLPTELASQVQFMEVGDVSGILQERNERDPDQIYFKLIFLNDKVEDHKADYQRDFLKIKDLAKRNKQIETVEKWQSKKLKDTYIKIGDQFDECEFETDWTK